ncbi:glutamine amidotransferase-like class 1 domain-containing protein 1 [Bacillus rossius redtenbacheri]|uniref:glutamine amidotransferase-like class 1 domain-containing protein 1 n=1 Tax=Bacillus rossius redtenbacheri TaxID=93214 RepID=UPI002FDE6D98
MSTTSGSKVSCLIVLPSVKEGVSAPSFIQCFTLTHSAFAVQLATPGGKTAEFINQDEQSRRWLNDFRTKPFAVPLSLEVIDPNRYTCLLIPHAPGAAYDLASNADLGQILHQFIKDKKIICAIGLGVAGLLSARSEEGASWGFKGYSLTGPSLFELARRPDFADLPVIPPDSILDRGGSFSACGESDGVHMVVDRHLVTAQNEASTLTAVQNLVLLCNQRQGKSGNK